MSILELTDDMKSALENGGVIAFDERGLMPLSEAENIVRGISEFRRGKGRIMNGIMVWDSDRIWAAFLSLENLEDFLREAFRVHWYFHPRGRGNLLLLSRYGEGILPWLMSFLRPDGYFVNVPWCIKDYLMAIDKKEVFDFLWKVHAVSDGTEGFPGPFAPDDPGDADIRMASKFNAKAPSQPDETADQLVLEWVQLHPVLGRECLQQLAVKGDARASGFLSSFN